MKGRTNCGTSGSSTNIKYIYPAAVLKILVPIDATISVSNGIITQTLNDNYKTNVVDLYNIYNYYVKPSQFGEWTITTTFDEVSKITTVIVNETKEYKINTILPSTYQQVTYIGASTTSADGAERINTGIIPTSTTCVSCHYIVLPGVDYTTYAWRALFGSNGTDGESDSFKLQQFNESQAAQVGINGAYTGGSETGFSAGYHYVKIDVKNKILISDELTKTLQVDSLEFVKPMSVVRSQWNASKASDPNYSKTQDFKIYDDDVLIQYFIPCYRISDNVIGMYEIVNDQFYITAGTTGGFTKGPDLIY